MYVLAGAMNPYQGAISAVGRILAEFDTNKRYPVYGFGAKVRLQYTQCFGPAPSI
jgi:hypothetical protein